MFNLKFDKFNAAMVGLYAAGCAVQDVVSARRKGRIDAINADFDEQERLLRERLALLEAERKQAEEDDLSWMD